jgi:hypothetical protein
MAKNKPATTADAEICLKLYDLRREAEMRKARNFVDFQFNPKSADEILKLAMAFGSQENAWLRMVFSFWEMAASLVLEGVVSPSLFYAWNGEMVFLYAKYKPFLAEIRQKMENPEFFARVEAAINSAPEVKKRVEVIQKRLAKMMALMQKQAAAE